MPRATHTDPDALAARGRQLPGIEYIRQIFSGQLPPPPIAELIGPDPRGG